MDIETLGLLGFAFAAIALTTRAYQRRMDVLYGPYIKGCVGRRAGLSVKRFWNPASLAIDRMLSLEDQRIIYLASATHQ